MRRIARPSMLSSRVTAPCLWDRLHGHAAMSIRTEWSLDFDGPLSRRDVCCLVVVLLIVACLDQDGHPLPSTAALLVSFVANLHVSAFLQRVLGAMACCRFQRPSLGDLPAPEWLSPKSIVSLANWRSMIASPVGPACATPLWTLSDCQSESRREVPSTVCRKKDLPTNMSCLVCFSQGCVLHVLRRLVPSTVGVAGVALGNNQLATHPLHQVFRAVFCFDH